MVARGTNDAASFRVKIMAKSFEFDLTAKYARHAVHRRARARVCVHTYLRTYARRTNVSHYSRSNAHYQFRMAESVHAKSTGTHQRNTTNAARTWLTDTWWSERHVGRAAPHCVVYENRIPGNNAVCARKQTASRVPARSENHADRFSAQSSPFRANRCAFAVLFFFYERKKSNFYVLYCYILLSTKEEKKAIIILYYTYYQYYLIIKDVGNAMQDLPFEIYPMFESIQFSLWSSKFLYFLSLNSVYFIVEIFGNQAYPDFL